MNEIEARVRRGITWLSKHHPNWRDKVDWGTMHMRSAGTCVLGQVIGDGKLSWYEVLLRAGMNQDTSIDLGFACLEEDNEELTDVWFEQAGPAVRPELVANLNPDYYRVTADGVLLGLLTREALDKLEILRSNYDSVIIEKAGAQ